MATRSRLGTPARTGQRRTREAAISASGILGGALIWELVGRSTDGTSFAPLSATLVRLGELLRDGSLISALASSMALYAAGLLWAIVVGLVGGLALARLRLLRVGLEDYITALYATPMVALIPFILAILGFGFFPKMVVVFLFAVFPVLLNTIEGARSIAPELLDVAKAYRSNERQLWRDVIAPYTLPFAMTGVRQAIARGLVGMVAAEFLLSSNGLGKLIIISSQRFDAAAILACVLVITLLGIALMTVGLALESKFAVWKV